MTTLPSGYSEATPPNAKDAVAMLPLMLGDENDAISLMDGERCVFGFWGGGGGGGGGGKGEDWEGKESRDGRQSVSLFVYTCVCVHGVFVCGCVCTFYMCSFCYSCVCEFQVESTNETPVDKMFIASEEWDRKWE